MVEIEEIKSITNIRYIKSIYILKGVLSYLKEKQKLDIIIYNQKLQKFLSVDFEYYKKTSGKYKIGEKNGNGKEFKLNTNKLIFEGEYLNGKRNGKGKEFFGDGKLKFEGEYINGKKWNGKGYNKYGDMEFEIKNGKGYIKEYNYCAQLIYEGEYLNGEKNRKGK